ncbi:MAG: T9SS type A sorting domain-containing protein [Flavobacterium sp.]|nr:MAG: T9SS type A sorting domain-containing protein [Flavobacterium sp.]
MKKITYLLILASLPSVSQTIGITPFATGLSSVVEITNAGDERLFVVQQSGAIKIVNTNGSVNGTNFLTLTTATISTGGERGLLGLAFDPNYATNRFFYLDYTRAGDGATVIARYSVNPTNPDVADASSGEVLLTIPQPFSNHNGGTLKFGPDGYLYIGMGDGGSGGDPGNRAQNINEYLGKLLRIDVSGGSGYSVPSDNPYAGATPGVDEIWAIGLRNPWKYSFDRSTGDLWLADVGQGEVEEINHVSSTDSGLNYGWKCYEGNAVYSSCTGTATFTFPVATYTHSGTGGCSITGGYVYRGSMFPNFVGKYFFADYCLNRIGMLTQPSTITYSSNFSGSNSFTTFGEDLAGELYVGSGGTVYRLVDTSLAVNNPLRNSFSLSPNPAKSEVFIRNAEGSTAKSVAVYDIAGKLLIEKQLSTSATNRLDTGTLQQGIYLVSVTDTTGSKQTMKLTIQ